MHIIPFSWVENKEGDKKKCKKKSPETAGLRGKQNKHTKKNYWIFLLYFIRFTELLLLFTKKSQEGGQVRICDQNGKTVQFVSHRWLQIQPTKELQLGWGLLVAQC